MHTPPLPAASGLIFKAASTRLRVSDVRSRLQAAAADGSGHGAVQGEASGFSSRVRRTGVAPAGR